MPAVRRHNGICVAHPPVFSPAEKLHGGLYANGDGHARKEQQLQSTRMQKLMVGDMQLALIVTRATACCPYSSTRVQGWVSPCVLV
jgi:hypothetical protein